MPTVADILIDGLAAPASARIFGVPGGGSNLELLEAARVAGLPFVLCHQESAACIMAAVTGELTGAPGRRAVHAGPGRQRERDRARPRVPGPEPADLSVRPPPRAALGFTTHQAFDHAAFLTPMVKGSLAVTAESASHWIAHAAQLAMKEPSGPVHLDLPADVASQPPCRRGEPRRPAPHATRRPPPISTAPPP